MGHESANWGVVRVRLCIIYVHLCNHIPLRSGGGAWGTALYTIRGVGSGSRDVDSWCADGLYTEGRGLQVPMVGHPIDKNLLSTINKNAY